MLNSTSAFMKIAPCSTKVCYTPRAIINITCDNDFCAKNEFIYDINARKCSVTRLEHSWLNSGLLHPH